MASCFDNFIIVSILINPLYTIDVKKTSRNKVLVNTVDVFLRPAISLSFLTEIL